MNLTSVGKILVYVNLVLSMFFVAVAFGLYTNRINWPGSGASDPGELAPKVERVKGLEKARDSTVEAWRNAQDALVAAEQRRPAMQEWYRQQLAALDGVNPAGKAIQAPVRSLRYVNGQLAFDNRGFPAFGPPGNLQSRRGFVEALSQTHQDILKELENIKELDQQEKTLTQEINGEEGKQKGLRDVLAEARTTQENAAKERKDLRMMRYNRQAEADLLAFRKDQLSNRLKDLKRGSGVAAR